MKVTTALMLERPWFAPHSHNGVKYASPLGIHVLLILWTRPDESALLQFTALPGDDVQNRSIQRAITVGSMFNLSVRLDANNTYPRVINMGCADEMPQHLWYWQGCVCNTKTDLRCGCKCMHMVFRVCYNHDIGIFSVWYWCEVGERSCYWQALLGNEYVHYM